MVFSSITFLFYFLPIFLALYFVTPTIKAKNLVTLFFSLVFYAWGEPEFILVLLFSIAFNFLAALAIDRREGSARRVALTVAVAGNLLVLGVFKYANFVTANVAGAMALFGLAIAPTNIHLPLGISFFTFHCLSYVIDIYRRRFRANRDPVDVALYISLFPQLVAGPIVRYKTVARQLDARRFTLGRASVGARIFIIGLAQKVLVADVVAPLVQVAFDQVHDRSLGGGVDRADFLHRTDLFRLCRLFQHGDRARHRARLHLPAQFPHAVHVAVDHRILAPLAHVAVVVAARLSLHSPRRQPRLECANLSQSHHGVPALRPLAWSELDLRPVGAPGTAPSW